MTGKITGIILAGGNSSRMGTDKAFIQFKCKKLIEYSISLMQDICDEVIISANSPQYETFGLRVIPDNYPPIGPLGGLEASLTYSKTKHNLVIPADTPFLTLNVYYEILKNLNGQSAIVPLNLDNKPEPLTAYYSKEILPLIWSQIGNSNYKIQDLLNEASAEFIKFPTNDVFLNLNTKADLVSNSNFPEMNLPNIILIAGNGRNYGKTFLACNIIKHLSTFSQVIGIKISPHYHEQHDQSNIISENKNFIIINEKSITRKDSSLMLQAGAKRVYFIMAKREYLHQALTAIRSQIAGHSVVCESGGLHEFVQPGLFLFVKRKVDLVKNQNLLKYAPIIVNNHMGICDFDEKRIGFNNDRVTINMNESNLTLKE
ncbi:MAG TPA: molybdenum cofactor guanylyltransferase [Bacteroides sp.]|nr:molybdenum cofactor guanylyltransferase [Bacteroides sp.]